MKPVGIIHKAKTKAAFTLNDFGDQERNLMFAKTDFHVNSHFMSPVVNRLSNLFINHILRDLYSTRILFLRAFRSETCLSNLYV